MRRGEQKLKECPRDKNHDKTPCLVRSQELLRNGDLQ